MAVRYTAVEILGCSMAVKYPEYFSKRLFGLSLTSMPVTLNLRIGEGVDF